MKKIAVVASAALLSLSAMSAQAQIEPVSNQELSEVDGQLLLALAVAGVETRKHDAMLRVAQSFDLAREVHETAEGLSRAALLAAYTGHEVAEGAARAGLVAAYVTKEVIVGEILGEVLSIEEDFRTRLNLIDAFRPGND